MWNEMALKRTDDVTTLIELDFISKQLEDIDAQFR